MPCNQHATLTPDGEQRFTANVGEQWASLKGAHGGIVASLIVDAAETVLREQGVDRSTSLRSATFGYLSGNETGESSIEIEIVRQGRSMVATHARVIQNGGVTTVARLHHSSPRQGLEFSDAEQLDPKPDSAVRFEPTGAAHLNNVETYFHPDTMPFSGGDRAEWVAWCRPLDADTIDTSWLTMFGDYFPPAVFARLEQPTLAVTIEYSIQIHDTAGSWTLAPGDHLAARMHTFHSKDGFAVEDGLIQHPDGTLLATVRQTRLAG